jgi:adenylate kinase
VAGVAKRIVLLGAPGSGKGTQAALLAVALKLPAISTGEMLRAAVAAGTELGERVESILNAGDLVDDATMADVVRERLERDDAREGFLLDGYPRTLAQSDTLAAILAESGQTLDAVVQVEVPEIELVRRALARQRGDDTKEVIRTRLRVYEKNTAPLVDLYRERGLLRPIDGDQSISAVAAAIQASLREAA